MGNWNEVLRSVRSERSVWSTEVQEFDRLTETAVVGESRRFPTPDRWDDRPSESKATGPGRLHVRVGDAAAAETRGVSGKETAGSNDTRFTVIHTTVHFG